MASDQDIVKSLFSLAKYNNGYFKSDKQRDFLLKMRNDGDAYVGGYGNIYGNTYFYVFYFDDLGVKKIVRNSGKKETTTFERESDVEMDKKKELLLPLKKKRDEIILNIENAKKSLEEKQNEIKKLHDDMLSYLTDIAKKYPKPYPQEVNDDITKRSTEAWDIQQRLEKEIKELKELAYVDPFSLPEYREIYNKLKELGYTKRDLDSLKYTNESIMKKHLIRIINEEISNFDYLSQDQIQEENNVESVLKSRDFQTKLVYDLVNSWENPNIIKNKEVIEQSSNIEDLEPDSTQRLNVSFIADFNYDYNGQELPLSIIVEGENMWQDLNITRQSGDYYTPPTADATLDYDWKDIRVKVMYDGAIEVELNWLYDNEEKYKKFVYYFVGHLLDI